MSRCSLLRDYFNPLRQLQILIMLALISLLVFSHTIWATSQDGGKLLACGHAYYSPLNVFAVRQLFTLIL